LGKANEPAGRREVGGATVVSEYEVGELAPADPAVDKERPPEKQKSLGGRRDRDTGSLDISNQARTTLRNGAKEIREVPLLTLAHHIAELVREAYRRNRNDGARGVDGVRRAGRVREATGGHHPGTFTARRSPGSLL